MNHGRRSAASAFFNSLLRAHPDRRKLETNRQKPTPEQQN
jgi:hypothetical protein